MCIPNIDWSGKWYLWSVNIPSSRSHVSIISFLATAVLRNSGNFSRDFGVVVGYEENCCIAYSIQNEGANVLLDLVASPQSKG